MSNPVLNSRQQLVLQYVFDEGGSQVNELALRFSVTEQTIRSDLNKLCIRF